MKSFLAVFIGLLFTILVTILVDIVLHVVGVYGPINQPLSNGLAALALSYRVVITIAGAWLTARLAPANPMKHALILGAIGTLLGVIGVVTTWNKGMGPHWYPVAIAVLAIPQCWLGGKLFEMRSGAPAR